MVKADDKVVYEENEPEEFTHFELLQKEVEVLKESLDEIIEILRYNNLSRKKEIEPADFDEDEVFKRLEEDKEWTNKN